ncbi:hypothetical protein PTI98_002058 [Pleurotus ostreatus]|nr:hypothetical protein PTI98_002058 [Pleurotus ostreatus]
MANIALGFAPLTPNSILHLPLTNENVPQVMQLLASLREQYDQQPNSITWTTPGSDNVRYLVPTNIPDLATNKNFVKEKKQYYAVTSGAQVGVVKGANTATALIHGVSGGVCLGFRSEALAVEHFQKGVNGGTVVVCKPVGSPM